eukprot:GHVS01069664.1.p1 GENE.GHVS01069664.1~~GHVS01069664.1.p1  ORF type:complete len:261 (-),score=48.64 GHVS01069664.1:1067-1849(-)
MEFSHRQHRRHVPWKSFAFALVLTLSGCLFFYSGAKILYFSFCSASTPQSITSDSSSLSPSSVSSSPPSSIDALPYVIYGILLVVPGFYHMVLFILATFKVKGFAYSMIAFSGREDDDEVDDEPSLLPKEEQRQREQMRRWCMRQAQSDGDHDEGQFDGKDLSSSDSSEDGSEELDEVERYKQERRLDTSSDESMHDIDDNESEDENEHCETFTITGDGIAEGLQRREDNKQMVDPPTGKDDCRKCGGEEIRDSGMRRRR